MTIIFFFGYQRLTNIGFEKHYNAYKVEIDDLFFIKPASFQSKFSYIFNGVNNLQLVNWNWIIVVYIGCCGSNSLHEVTILWWKRTHKCVFEQRASVTVFSTSVEFAYPSRRRGMQLHLSKNSCRSKLLKNTRVSLRASQSCFRSNELCSSIQCSLFYCLLHAKVNFTQKFPKNDPKIWHHVMDHFTRGHIAM